MTRTMRTEIWMTMNSKPKQTMNWKTNSERYSTTMTIETMTKMTTIVMKNLTTMIAKYSKTNCWKKYSLTSYLNWNWTGSCWRTKSFGYWTMSWMDSQLKMTMTKSLIHSMTIDSNSIG